MTPSDWTPASAGTFFEWMEKHPGLGAWAQAIAAALAIVGVFMAAGIPAWIENRARRKERELQAAGMVELLHMDVIVLKNLVKKAVDEGADPDKPPIQIPENIRAHAHQLYILGEDGGRLLQAIGILNGVAAKITELKNTPITDPDRQSKKERLSPSLVKMLLIALHNCEHVHASLGRTKSLWDRH